MRVNCDRARVIAMLRDVHESATRIEHLACFMTQAPEVSVRNARMSWALALLAGTALLASAALYNGYPLTFWDTRVYIESATTLMPRGDRLIGYGFLLHAASWLGTLWPIVIAQCALLAWLLQRVLARLRPGLGVTAYLTCIGLLASCTALPWIAGQLMADIFTPVLVLALFLYIEDESLTKLRRLALLALVALCVTVHLTHLPLGLALLALAWLWLRARKAVALQRRLLAPALALLFGLAAIGGWNTVRVGRWTLASGSDAFVFGHLVESGIASRMLDAHCPEREYWLCPYRARLPMGTDELLWVDALNLKPWDHPAAVSGEVSRLLRDSLREVPLLHARVAALSTLRVLGRFATGEGLDSDARSLIEEKLQTLAPGDVRAFEASRQQRDAIPVATLRLLHTPIGWALIALALLALTRWAWRKDLGTAELRFLLFAVTAWFLNGVLSANLSGIYDRYESRLVWLFGVWLLAWVKMPVFASWRARWRGVETKVSLITRVTRASRANTALRTRPHTSRPQTRS